MKYICSNCHYYRQENPDCGWCRLMKDWIPSNDYPCRHYYAKKNEKTA